MLGGQAGDKRWIDGCGRWIGRGRELRGVGRSHKGLCRHSQGRIARRPWKRRYSRDRLMSQGRALRGHVSRIRQGLRVLGILWELRVLRILRIGRRIKGHQLRLYRGLGKLTVLRPHLWSRPGSRQSGGNGAGPVVVVEHRSASRSWRRWRHLRTGGKNRDQADGEKNSFHNPNLTVKGGTTSFKQCNRLTLSSHNKILEWLGNKAMFRRRSLAR